MKTLNIEIPSGHEIDQENTNLSEGKIVFKQTKKGLPKTWEDLGMVKGYYIGALSGISPFDGGESTINNRNTFATVELAEASIAMAQLSQLREVYRDGWKPNWEDENQKKYTIYFRGNEVIKYYNFDMHKFLCFQTPEIRDEFLNNFRDLIETAKPLMS